MANYIYSVASDITSGTCNPRTLNSEILAAALVTQLSGVTLAGDVLTISFNATLSAGDEATLDTLVADHVGLPSPSDPTQVEVVLQEYTPPFAAKVLPNGGKLFKRDTGKAYAVTTGNTDCDYVITHSIAKITGVEIINAEPGDYCDFEVYDTPDGDISGYPNVKLNQFGFSVYPGKDFYKRDCQYDADLIAGIKIRIKYNSVSNKNIYVNYLLHEVV